MNLCEDLIRETALEVCGSTKITYQGQEVDFTSPWPRIGMAEAVKKESGIDFFAWQSDEEARACLKERNIKTEPHFTRGDCLAELFDEYVEHKLVQPTFIVDYPVEVSPLARASDTKAGITERFELFITGREIANGFSELNDPEDQAARFQAQVQAKDAGDEEAMFYDADYIRALEYGMPPTGGCGIGIDRLMMLLTDSASIRDVLLFPHLRKEEEIK